MRKRRTVLQRRRTEALFVSAISTEKKRDFL